VKWRERHVLAVLVHRGSRDCATTARSYQNDFVARCRSNAAGAALPEQAAETGSSSAGEPKGRPLSRPAVTFQVVIPSWNQGRYIGSAIRSVLDQSAEVDLELAIVDACSSDETEVEIAQALQLPHRARVSVIREPDDGQSDAINKGVAYGEGEIISWLNADDVLMPASLVRVARFFAEADPEVAVVYGDIHFIDPAGATTGTLRGLPFRRSDLLWGPGYIPQPATFVRRTAWEAVNGVRRDLHYAMDADLWLRLCARWRIEHLPEVLACFRQHETQKTVTAARSMRAEWRRVQYEHGRAELGRTPWPLEVAARKILVRLSRRIRRACASLRQHAAQRPLVK
jgi:hypothetical protein